MSPRPSFEGSEQVISEEGASMNTKSSDRQAKVMEG